jgi:negative regulator of replication initiation
LIDVEGVIMAMQVTLKIREETYRYAEWLSRSTGRSVSDILGTLLDNTLPAPERSTQILKPVEELTDSEVLALSEFQMSPREDRRLSDLLRAQQERNLTQAEHEDLDRLMQVYQQGLLRKAQALREAVHRGLRAPLNP